MRTHDLMDICPTDSVELANELRAALSIESAEELISFSTVYNGHIKKIVGGREKQWKELLSAAENCIPADKLKILQKPATDNPPPGAIM